MTSSTAMEKEALWSTLKQVLSPVGKAAFGASKNALTHGVSGKHGLTAAQIAEGYKHTAKRDGVDSLLTALPQMAAEKVLGEDKVRDFVHKHVSDPFLRGDTAAGNILSKTPVIGGLFKAKEKILTDPAKGAWHEVERNSALAPLTKVRNLAEPIVMVYAADKGANKLKDWAQKRKDAKEHAKMNQQNLMQKAASTMLRLDDENKGHTKRAQALRLLYKQAEMGIAQVPQTFGELEEKLAHLINEDLVVLEKAMDLAGGNIKLGELSSTEIKARNPSDMFRAAILGDSEDYY
jgi:hypothetical protein